MNCFEYSTENQEKEDKPKEEEAKEQVVEEKAKAKSSQPKEASPAFMSSIFAFLDVYRNKMLVSPHITYTYSLNISFFSSLLFCLAQKIVSKMWIRSYKAVSGNLSVNQTSSLQNYLARNFYNLRFLALFVCFAINFILLFYKVIQVKFS